MSGRIEVIAGCMFSGKTEELIRRLRRVVSAKQPVLLVKPSIDDRYSDKEVVSHSDYRMSAQPIRTLRPERIAELWEEVGCPLTLGIDEGQFFPGLAPVVEGLAARGVRVLVAGLDLDYRGGPFLDPKLLALAEDVTKLTAVCMTCGSPANRTQRLSGGTERVEVGAAEAYEARCREHWTGGAQ
jgi:thymidine kinase